MDAIIEKQFWDIGIYKIVGVDEAGRGSLCGPVVVSSVLLPVNHGIKGINDSKKVSPKRRLAVAEQIYERALDVQIVFGSHECVDVYNVYNTTKLCIKEVLDKVKIKPTIAVIDGEFTPFEGKYELPFLYQTIPGGDSLSENIAAASIIAKTCRDLHMIEESKKYPNYDFDKHKGYGTKEHMEALFKYGPCAIHRKSFTIKGIRIGDIDGSF